MGNACHGHPSNLFSCLLASEGEFEQARQVDGVFEKALKEISEPVKQHPLGMGGFELHVMAQHRRELLWFDLAVVRPGRQIVVASIGFGMLLLFLALKFALTGALLGILRQLEIIELIGLTLFVLPSNWRRTGRFRIPKKVALQGQVRLGHGWRSDPWLSLIHI